MNKTITEMSAENSRSNPQGKSNRVLLWSHQNALYEVVTYKTTNKTNDGRAIDVADINGRDFKLSIKLLILWRGMQSTVYIWLLFKDNYFRRQLKIWACINLFRILIVVSRKSTSNSGQQLYSRYINIRMTIFTPDNKTRN